VFTIFLIDDDFDDQEIFAFVLRQIDETAKCFFANDGMSALEKLTTDNSFVPDIIFIDMNMPGINGMESLAEIKKITHLQNVPIYMYSTSTEKRIVEVCKKLGATGFIKKDIDTDNFRNELIEILSLLKIPVQHADLRKDT
jgi:CheY-like chemotaxis protein